ncbi:MAG: oligosaccharide flippase family protein, partial [Caulobacteraceae bacterium]
MFQPAASQDSLAEARADKPASPRRAFFGSVALGVVNCGRIGLQTVVLPIVARMLGPGAFGLVALAMPFILFATMLSDGGMGAALVRRSGVSREVESTVFWLSVGMGVAVAALVCAVAPLAARLMRQPELTYVIFALAPILILSSGLSPANARISRSRNFALFAVGDFLSIIFSSAAAILAAVSGLGAWSLVIQQLVLWCVKAAWVLPASGFRPALVCRPSLVKDLLAFGLNNVGANIADFLGKSAPALVIGAELGVFAVGRYSMAYQLVRVPDLVISGPLFLATFTAVAALAANVAGSAQLSLRTLRLVVTALAPTFCGLALVADLAVGVFLGPKWHGAGPALAALAPAGFFLCLYSTIGAVLMGLGRSDLQFRLSAVCGFGMLGGAVLG